MIRRLLAAIWLALLPIAAAAQQQPCLDLTYTWTTPYSKGSIQATSYSVTDLWFQVVFFNQNISVYQGVPQPVAQQFTNLPNGADSQYNTRIKGHYSQAILSTRGCPLLANQTGKFLLSNTP